MTCRLTVLCVSAGSWAARLMISCFPTASMAISEPMVVSGAPALSGAIACFDTTIVRTLKVGTHTIFLCDRLDVALGETPVGLVYFQRRYRHLRAPQEPGFQFPCLASKS
jgi:flavin reductase